MLRMSPIYFDLITIFPSFFQGPLDFGIVRQAIKKRLVSVRIHDLRDHTDNRHQTVDDRPFGGGEGMVLKPEPVFRAVKNIAEEMSVTEKRIILLSPQGRRLDQQVAHELASCRQLILICGRYEGVDERVAEHLATDEISIGDFILSGGELAACVLMECVIRVVPGVLNNDRSVIHESFSHHPDKMVAGGTFQEHGILDYPQYTRPETFDGMNVPRLLLSGDHQKVRRWRRRKALEKTLRNRPDLLEYERLSEEDKSLLEKESSFFKDT